jgi:hypothetical protein
VGSGEVTRLSGSPRGQALASRTARGTPGGRGPSVQRRSVAARDAAGQAGAVQPEILAAPSLQIRRLGVTPSSDYGREWSVHHYGLAGHMADKVDDDADVAALLESDEISSFPSGELVAPLLDSLLSHRPTALPVNLPNQGQVQNLPDGVVVECMGLAADDQRVVARDEAHVPSMPGEQLRRVAVSEELTVEAALTGNPTTVLEAMLADPMAGRLPYEHVVAMTDELLQSTASWLPQFAR